MKTRISLLTILSVMLICLSGCTNKKEFEEFSFTYSIGKCGQLQDGCNLRQ
jgi:hypothetical protein